MGCSPSHAVIINSSPTHETICLQPRIYMVSESTLCLLKDVGELRVYNIDETDPAKAAEKFRGAQEQLQNPLLFHPQLRGRERSNTDDSRSLSSDSGSSSVHVGKEISTGGQDINQSDGDMVEVSQNEEEGDSVDYQSQYGTGGIASEERKQMLKDGAARTSNAHSTIVEVYSYRTSEDGSTAENESKRESLAMEPPYIVDSASTAASVDVVSSIEQDRTLEDTQSESKIEELDVLPDATFGWSETSCRGIPAAKASEHLGNANQAKRKEATIEDTLELKSL